MDKLYEALKSGSTQSVLSLICNKDINFHFEDGETPLLFALASSRHEVVEVMLKSADINLANKATQVTPIQRAYMCSFQLDDTLKKMLCKNPNVNLIDVNRNNLITKVIDNQDSATLEYLLNHTQVNLNVICRNTRPLFIEVINNKDFKTLDVLLTHASKKQLDDFQKQFLRYEDYIAQDIRKNVDQKLQSSVLSHQLERELPQKIETARKNKI